MTSLQFLIDNMCAKFTERAIYSLVGALIAEKPGTIGDIAARIVERDRSLDFKSAEALAQAAVESLRQRGVVTVQGDNIYLVGCNISS